jgi:hypothetical protein
MNLPGFGAEASLPRRSGAYLRKVPGRLAAAEAIQPALQGNWNFLGCSLQCDEYTRCDEFGCIPSITVCTLSCWGLFSTSFSFESRS